MEKNEKDILIIDQAYATAGATEQECEALAPFITDFVTYYEQNQDKPVEVWLSEKLQLEMPEKSKEEITALSQEIIDSLQVFEDNKVSLTEHLSKKGRSKESWFATELKKYTSKLSTDKAAEYIQGLVETINTAKDALKRTLIARTTGDVSKNPQLHGFIAEREHVNSFNVNAEMASSQYRAKVVEHVGEAFPKDGVDVVIVDANGAVTKKYNFKYYNKPGKTAGALEGHRGQQKIGPSDQVSDIQKIYDKQGANRKVVDHLEAPDGTCSDPLTYKQSTQIRDEAQSGKWDEKHFNEYKAKDLAVGLGKQVAKAGVVGAMVGAGTEIAEKLYNGEKIEEREVAKKAVEGGVDFGLKAAVAGGLQVGTEKSVIIQKVLPKGTPAATYANVAFVAIENAKVLYDYSQKKITGTQALEKMEETTVSAVAGLAAMGVGADLGAKAGALVGTAIGGPIGTAIGAAVGTLGGFVGGAVAYMAGSTVGKAVVSAKRKIAPIAKNVISSAIKKTTSVVSSIKTTVSSSVNSFVSALKFW